MEMLQVLAPDGSLLGEPPFDVGRARSLMEAMVVARLLDRKLSSLQRQGRLATYAPFEGQEAAQIGSAAALDPDDWMAGTYRDAAAMHHHGYPLVNLLLFRMGDERGGAPPEGVDVLPASITVGAHMIHAVGLAWAERIKGTNRAAITYFGDGATSEGDFHEAMNFAGVYATPTVFVCENNAYAISLHRSRQTASETIASKASAYGMPGVLVDGNDAYAMYAATSEALDRARAGEGPTLIEAVTYRLGPHTTTDDPGRYRSEAEAEEWRRRDPLDRMRAHLAAEGAWDEAHEDQIAASATEEIEAAVEEAEDTEPLGPDAAFDRMFAVPTRAMERQRAALLRELGET